MKNLQPITMGSELLDKVHQRQVELLQEFVTICNKYDLKYWLDFGSLLGAVRHDGHFIPWDDDLDVSMPRKDFQQFCRIAQSELPDSVFLQTAETDPYYDIYMVEAKLRDNNSIFIEDPKARFHQGVYIDIFPYDKTFPDQKRRKKHQRKYKKKIVGYRQNIVTSLPLWKDMRPLRKKVLTLLYKIMSVEKREKKILNEWKKGSDYVWRPTLASPNDDTPVDEKDLFPLNHLHFEGVDVLVPHNPKSHLKALYGDWKKLPPEENRCPAHSCHVDMETPCSWSREEGFRFTA